MCIYNEETAKQFLMLEIDLYLLRYGTRNINIDFKYVQKLYSTEHHIMMLCAA